MPDIVITVNSPGELSAWVRPTVEKLADTHPELRIILVITPCQYASGQEAEVAREFKGVSKIILPEEYNDWIRKGKSPKDIKFNEKGLVVFMGGDLLHAVLLAKKLKYKAIAYSERIQWVKDFYRFLVPDKATYDEFIKKAPDEKVKLVGNLMVDSINLKFGKEEALRRWDLSKDAPIITLMPGSRSFQTEFMVPFFLKVAKLISSEVKNAQFLLNLAPYVAADKIEPAVGAQRNVLVIKGANHEAVNASDMVLTIPGTNTAEIAALGVPMVVVFPLNEPGVFPLEGLLGILSNIPILGFLLKLLVVKIRDKSTKYFALPNIKAGKEITPEIRGVLKPEDVATVAVDLLKDKNRRELISRQLKEVMGEKGAVDKVVYEIILTLN